MIAGNFSIVEFDHEKRKIVLVSDKGVRIEVEGFKDLFIRANK